MNQLNKYKKDRVEGLLNKNLGEIITREMKKDICKLASINEVKFNDDLSVAHVYVSHLEPNKILPLVNFLNKNAGTIRAMLSRKMSIYKVPSLTFVIDESYKNGKKIEDILQNIKEKKLETLDDLIARNSKKDNTED